MSVEESLRKMLESIVKTRKAKGENYMVTVDVMDVIGECGVWNKGDVWYYPGAFYETRNIMRLPREQRRLPWFSSGWLCPFSVNQLFPIILGLIRGVSAVDLGFGKEPNIAYVSCQAPAPYYSKKSSLHPCFCPSPKGHGQVILRLTREPIETKFEDLFYAYLALEGKPGGTWTGQTLAKKPKTPLIEETLRRIREAEEQAGV